ncbi:nickel pincer cofactor biosynthesis protein LarB [Paenibacillus puerhi]|uniref:nickel pincer cofactor biosynthesis protein LarB n=1 Tax=Paenibacillus puerhi TaxID=2692622 RepID=UPI001357AF9C|nr:nickel pincer cofactor biosynthesis protein LarB [Paenibacillus puerhi]
MMNVDHILKLVQSGDLDVAEAKRLLEEERISSGAAAPPPSPDQPPLVKQAVEPLQTCTTVQRELPASGFDEAIDDSLSYAQLDVRRADRTGFPEVVFGEGKSAEQIAAIMERLAGHAGRVLATRVSADKAAIVQELLPDAVYHRDARALTWQTGDAKASVPIEPAGGFIAVVCAGTSDVPVAEEAAVTAEYLGSRVERVYDVGVAGIHRLFRRLPLIREADAIVVAAGMEGALVSVIGGLVSVPIIAVPTSVGYGASFQGVAALLAMLNACAPGISVVNIDNGFGAGYNASLIVKNRTKRDER